MNIYQLARFYVSACVDYDLHRYSRFAGQADILAFMLRLEGLDVHSPE